MSDGWLSKERRLLDRRLTGARQSGRFYRLPDERRDSNVRFELAA